MDIRLNQGLSPLPLTPSHKGRGNSGFTLVEIVLAISLIAILFATSSIVMRQGLDSYSHVSTRGTNVQDARYAIERMVRELIIAGDEVGTRIQSISANSINFVDSGGTNSDFSLVGATLYRGGSKLLENVTSFAVTGYDQSNNTTSSAPLIRRVRLQLVTTPVNHPAPLTLRTDIFVRNYLYDNFR